MNINTSEFRGYFLKFSELSTGFSESHLQETKQVNSYFDTVHEVIGGELFGELLQSFHEKGLEHVLESPKLGPIARNIIKLWYTATWDALPNRGKRDNNGTFIVSSSAYRSGLVWPTIKATPPGALSLGYGNWSKPPQFDD